MRMILGGYSKQPRRPTRLAISSGWAQTAGAQRYLQCYTKRRWQRELSPSCPNASPSEGLIVTSSAAHWRTTGEISGLLSSGRTTSPAS
ncbi:unnamed protein product [Oncorhynchus mykiss]|uniref:Uncharacterized protein n=1 Tax=Oncorhynchus mykiss TaxID=8022 RepID=A0A060WJG2_ONCMY|nr:unnamed protein product [Oncorhynchus mykiss]